MDRPELTIGPDVPVAFVDVETTGCALGRDRIIDVAVIGARGGEVEFEWQSLVNPGGLVGPGTTALTGIDNDMLAGAPSFADIARELRERLAGRVFVAHNARFDYGFIRREFARLDGDWHATSLCTVRLSRALYPDMPRHNLDAVMERHGIVIGQRHRAMPDAQALLEFWRRVRAEWPREELQRALEASAPRVTLPGSLPPDLGDDLPEEPGVYRFYGPGEQGTEELLYVGQANNLREAVLGHFRAGGESRNAKLAAQVRRVSWTETAGAVGAWLLEAREIRELHPAYNRAARAPGAHYTWLFGEGAPSIVELTAQALRSGNAFGAYRSRRDAEHALVEMARAHRWCLKVLGLEVGEGSCIGYQVGRCRGACVGTEPAALHLARVKLGLMRTRLEPWPHEGPMVLRESRDGLQQLHVFDAWQHLATADPGDSDLPLEEMLRHAVTRPHDFEYDDYRMLTRLLRDARLRPLAAS
ncbi:MAG TPA: exonuclease domain-containing protein [Steroidobacteraceae bacterium]|nr:exonuclease domain-containing protein [Steroidobacteraceae bacterium]